MTNQILRTVLAGILAGLALFMLPFFLLKVVLFFFILWAIGRLLWGGPRERWRRWAGMMNMTEEEKKAWMDRSGGWHCGNWDDRARWGKAETVEVKSNENENPVK